jgi:hypothetical protein
MPPWRRESPASSSALVKVGQVSTIGIAGVARGSIRDEPAGMVTWAPNRSLPVNIRKTRAPAALKVLWPDTYSGNGGVSEVIGW